MRHQPFLVLYFGQASVLDADGGDVGHHGEQIEIVLGEDARERRRVYVDQPDDAVFGLQRRGHERPDALPHDALALLESVVEHGIAHQHRIMGIEHAVAHGGADAKRAAFGRPHNQLAIRFLRHENAALGTHRLDGEIEDHLEQLGQ